MILSETRERILGIGSKVRMNIPRMEKAVEEDGDGCFVNIQTGKDYLQYAKEHPDEVYCVVKHKFFAHTCWYVLSGEMSGCQCGVEDIIPVIERKSRFESFKEMSLDEMASQMIPLIYYQLCSKGLPKEKEIQQWLGSCPNDEE